MLTSLATNYNRRNKDVRLFEMGNGSYSHKDPAGSYAALWLFSSSGHKDKECSQNPAQKNSSLQYDSSVGHWKKWKSPFLSMKKPELPVAPKGQ